MNLNQHGAFLPTRNIHFCLKLFYFNLKSNFHSNNCIYLSMTAMLLTLENLKLKTISIVYRLFRYHENI